MNNPTQSIQARIFNRIHSHKALLILCFLSTYLWGMLAHAYGFLHNNLSHDVLNAFTATPTEEIWKIELGRFFVPVYRMFFRGPVSLPWLIGIIGLFWLSIAVFLTARLLKLENKFAIIIVAGIMTTNITFISQIATYLYEFDFNALALLLSIAAVTFWRTGIRWKQFILAPLCLLISLSIYQAYITVTATIIIWLCIIDIIHQKNLRHILFEGIVGLFVLAIGMILYILLGKLIYSITGISPQARTDMFQMSNILNSIFSFVSLLKPTLTNLYENVMHIAYPQPLLFVLLWSTSILAFIQGIRLVFVKRFELGRSLLLILLLILLPFGMNCIYLFISGHGMHNLMCYAAWFVYIFLLHFALQFDAKTPFPGRLAKSTRVLAYALTLFILFQNVILANTCYVKKELEANATLSTMTRVVAALEQHEDYQYGETPVAFIGFDDSSTTIPGFERSSYITGMWATTAIPQDTSVYYYNVYKTYFRYVLNYPINLCSDEVHAQLKNDPAVQALPSFPDNDAIQMINGVLVIKM